MNCPKCGTPGFMSDRKPKKTIVPLSKEHYNSFNRRRYHCLVCAAMFMTEEKVSELIPLKLERTPHGN